MESIREPIISLKNLNLTAREYLTFIGELYGLTYKAAEGKSQKLMAMLGIEESYGWKENSIYNKRV
ncbi:MAG: hypothetical protein Q8936_05070 [Bacillota bacterium]|nr:hypothetical protein [Bacillota bacterium]